MGHQTKDIIALVFNYRAGDLIETVEQWIFEVRLPKDYTAKFKELAMETICEAQEGAMKDILWSALEGADWKAIAMAVYEEAKERVNREMEHEGYDDESPITWGDYRG